MSKIQKPEFIDYFFTTRLKRVPTDILKKFVKNLKNNKSDENIDKVTQAELIQEIKLYYELMQGNKELFTIFNEFMRDNFFSAKESEYLLQIPNKEKVVTWVNTWDNNRFLGQRYSFSKHAHIQLKEKFLTLDGQNISLPSEVLLIIAASHSSKLIASGLEIKEYNPTKEIELIFRKDMNLIEIRGSFDIIRDFVNTAVLDSHNPLSMAQSLFIGEREDAKSYAVVKTLSKVVKIDALKIALNGKYLSASAPVNGIKTSRIQASFEELDNIEEETHPLIKPMLEELLKDSDKSKILFIYDKKKYTFAITKSGGLNFLRYAPEEVITYVVSKINSLE
ncbi:MAG: hypothetical protein RMY16_23415 [Nostoc sp. DedQUE12b]|uniref:hypothetical protein n=1 Tax=Nostoc sp. DedQUE12b TaxID=3075398 RepID=UPI002AD2C722|nr:hypothetical protein [Nostoc sp. DedQUE12b]MDZ8088484.1 hypothetical protein [Nostoc sp. DedQUE12b]